MGDNIDLIKQAIYEQIQRILLSDELTEENKQKIFEQAYIILEN
jgi:hypothetical protein